jgi:DNA-binding response OmpR family regulator
MGIDNIILEQDENSRILIVDDNVKNLQVLGGFLHNEGYSVEFALDGNSALDWISRNSFDLVLLDIMMPGIDGYEVCRAVKKEEKNKDLPLIFLTAKIDHESVIEGFEAGAVDYITKPFIKDELLARVRTHLEIKKSRDRLAEYLGVIEEKSRNITASIEYAKNIQEAMLKTSLEFKELIPEHFILYLPKDIVSGDFYWFTCIDNLIVIAVMDCTGHGVPGALMSTLGITLLNETVLREKILRPDLILENLRAKLIKTLSQKGYPGIIKDGIEGSVFCFDTFMNHFHYSGSCNSMIIIHEGELQEIKPQRIPIGYSDKEVDFENVSLSLSKNDLVYMFSDGYLDQFGGPEAKTKRFMIKRFKEILMANQTLPLEQQREILLSELLAWKGDSDQTDDILVLGIRF